MNLLSTGAVGSSDDGSIDRLTLFKWESRGYFLGSARVGILE